MPACTHLLKVPGTSMCRACTAHERWWDDYLGSWYRVGMAHASRPLIANKALVADCRRRFSVFFREAWKVLRPGVPLVWTWYLEAICDHVQWVLEEWRRCRKDRSYFSPDHHRNLAVSIPPLSGKTIAISVMAPAWMWIDSPEWSVLCLSVNPGVARDCAVDCRNLVQSPWYRQNFCLGLSQGEGRAAEIDHGARASGTPQRDGVGPSREGAVDFDAWEAGVAANAAGKETALWALSDERNTMGKFVNTRGGFRASQGMTAQIIGARADALFVDDPNAAESSIDGFLDTNLRWESVIYNRVNDFVRCVRVVIQQRLDQFDLTGHLLDDARRSAITHLCLPLLFDPERAWKDEHGVERQGACVTEMPVTAQNRLWVARDGGQPAGTWRDPRTVANQVLSPKRWSPAVVARARTSPAFWTTQQQDVTRVSSGNFEPQHWAFWVRSDLGPDLRALYKACRPLGCDRDREAVAVPVDRHTGRLGCARVWVTDDPTLGSESPEASHVGLLVVAEWTNPAGERTWLVVHDMETGPRSPATQLDDLDRAIHLAAKMTGHDRVRVLIEDKAAGGGHAESVMRHVTAGAYERVAVTAELFRARTTESKENRNLAYLDAPHASGRILLPDGAPWLTKFVAEFRRFPKPPNDKVDALGQLVAHTTPSTKGWGAAFANAAGLRTV